MRGFRFHDLSPDFRAVLAGALALALFAPMAWSRPASIQRLDTRLDRLIAADAVVEKISDGHRWIEGPVWVAGRASQATLAAAGRARVRMSGPGFKTATGVPSWMASPPAGFLLFTDIPLNRVLRLRPGFGAEVFLDRAGYTGSAPFAGSEPGANGLTLDPQGRLVLAEHGDRRVSRLNQDGSKTTLVDRYLGRRLNSPNDVVYDARGNLYFTDPPFGLPGTFSSPARELDFFGVYRLSPGGELRLLTKQLRAPNGIALSPDEKTLYVTDVDPRRPAWWAFPLENGLTGPGRIFRSAEPFARHGAGGPDGLKVDREGHLFASGPGGIYVFDAAARLLGRIDLGSAASNLAWGEDGGTLFITADHAVYRLRTLTRAARLPGAIR